MSRAIRFLLFAVLATQLGAATAPPQLIPGGTAARWKQSYQPAKDEPGAYRLMRSRGRDSIMIVASRRPSPVPKTIDQPAPGGKTVSLPVSLKAVPVPALGRTVQFYDAGGGFGDVDDTYRTEPIPWPDGQGGTLYFQIEVVCYRTTPKKLIAAVRWRR